MASTYPDGCQSVIAIDVAVEEKTRVARMAAATLHKLHDAMHRMKDWRDESVKLKSSIWRMRMALQTDDKLENVDQRVNPLIAHQKAQISRLERANDDLENQVISLKRAISKAEGDAVPIREVGDQIVRIKEKFAHERECLNDEILSLKTRLRQAEEEQTSVTVEHHFKDKLLEFAKGDRTIEIVLANVIGRIVETVVGLSEGLVYVSEDLCRFKSKNRNLHRKLDRLRAMLRTRCGGGAEYRKRIGELSDLAARLLGEMGRLKATHENANVRDDVSDIVKRIERLMRDLRNSLRNEREALIAAGDPDCLRYMKKVVDLRVNLRVLSVELRRSNALTRERSRESMQRDDCRGTVSVLSDFLREIDAETERVKIKPMNKYCRIGGMSGRRYVAKIAQLEGIVRQSIGVIGTLKRDSSAEIMNASGMATEELAESIERLCRKIKDLEALDDRASLRGRIDRLEGTVTRLKLELTARDGRIRALNDEHASVTSCLKRARERHEKIVADMSAENESLREDINNRKREISELSRMREHSARRATEVQLMKAEIDAARKKLRDLHDDREASLRETERVRNTLRRRDKEIENVLTERDALGRKLEAEVGELKAKLEIASDENAKLKSTIQSAEESDKTNSPMMAGDKVGQDERDESARNSRDESERLKAELNAAKISLNEANERIDHLRGALDKAVGDRARLEGEICDFKSNEQSLTHRLNMRTSACEAATRDNARATAENKALASKVKQLWDGNEQLAAELSKLKSEKELLARAIADANNVGGSLQRKISEREAVAESFKSQLARARADLEYAGVETARLRAENGRIVGDLESLRNSGAEERVRVLLTEKNELATRINELNGESVALRGRLNKAEAENEYFSIELNKSRLENDRMKTKNALLQVTCDKRERDNGTLRRERNDVRERLNEIGSECRILGNQLGIQRMKYEALRFAAATLYRESNDRKSHLKKIDTRHPLARAGEAGFGGARNDVKHKRDYSDAVCAGIKAELAELGDAEFKVESDARAHVHDNKAKIKDEPKSGGPKCLTARSKALRLELADLRSEEQVAETESTCTKGEGKSTLAWTEGSNVGEVVGSVLTRHEVVNICYKRKTSDYPSYPGDPAIFRDEGRRWSTMVAIDRLEVENAALKLELDILRNSLNCSLTEGDKTKLELGRATEETQALKLELVNLREERAALRSRLETFKEELNALRSERVALKEELAALRKSNFDLRLKANDLRAVHERLKETNVGLEKRLQDALRINQDATAVASER